MIADWFTNKCMTLVNENGRALKGAELDAPDRALQDVINAKYKVWTDYTGKVYYKERALFAASKPLLDCNGKQVRICGKKVNVQANFCNKCGAPAPGTTWRCSGCGKLIGSESKNCSYCGKEQTPSTRMDISSGSWRKSEDILAERFDLDNVAQLMPEGINIYESQRGILLDGGSVINILAPGFYSSEFLKNANSQRNKNLILVDASEFVLPIAVEKLLSMDDIECRMHLSLVSRFNPAKAKSFMTNMMVNSIFLSGETTSYALGYDAITDAIMADSISAIKDFCNTRTIDTLVKDASTRMELEKYISDRLSREFDAAGFDFVRIKAVEFTSVTIDNFRKMSGQIEEKRREIELSQRADTLANDITKQKVMSENEMTLLMEQLKADTDKKRSAAEKEMEIFKKQLESDAVKQKSASDFDKDDFLKQLAHENLIKDNMRIHELENMRKNWEREQEKNELIHSNLLKDLETEKLLERKRMEEKFKQELDDIILQKQQELDDIKRRREKEQCADEQDATEKWLKIKQHKQSFNLQQKIELMKAASDTDLHALLMVEDNPGKRSDLLALYEQQQRSKMSPESILANAAANGNTVAAEALNNLTQAAAEPFNYTHKKFEEERKMQAAFMQERKNILEEKERLEAELKKMLEEKKLMENEEQIRKCSNSDTANNETSANEENSGTNE